MDKGQTQDDSLLRHLPHFSHAAFDIVALAASAGGPTALSHLLAALPADFPGALVVVQHLDPRHCSLMAEILSQRTHLQVKQPEEEDRLHPATVYIAPPNRHLLVNPDGTLSLSQSELVHFVRPTADLLFESVAASYKDRAIAVVLTGTGSDGAMEGTSNQEDGRHGHCPGCAHVRVFRHAGSRDSEWER